MLRPYILSVLWLIVSNSSVMDTSDDDEDLKRAITLSLQEQDHHSKPLASQEVIDLDADDETDVTSITAYVPSASVPASLGLLGLDRKAMEQERLARKRKASVSPPPPRKVAKASATSTTPPHSINIRNLNHSVSPGPIYLDGVVKKTWAFGHERNDDIKIEEVLQRNHLNLAVLSSFQWNVEWILNKVNTHSTQVYFVMQAKDESTKTQYRQETARMANLRLCFPSMEGQVNCMHSKLMLLSYPTHLRVVVPTANLVPYDWGETGVMENMAFLIDLPRLPNDGHVSTNKLTTFGKDLIYFLQAMGLEESVIQSVQKFDFSKTNDLAFVHTIGGAHTNNESWRRTGYCGLGRAVNQLGLSTREPLDLNFVTSSVGSLNIGFLTTLYLAAQGDDGLTDYRWRNTKTKAGLSSADKKAEQSHQNMEMDVNQDFHIYFPTRDTVVHSTGGAPCGGTICFQKKWYVSPTFPKHLLRDCKSRREGMLMHNKVCRSSMVLPELYPS